MSTQRSSRNRTGAVAVLVTSLLLIIGAVAYIGFAMTSSSGETLSRDFEGTGNGVEQIVEIPEGSSMSALGPELEERGIVKSDAAFQTAAANNPNSANIQPGFFRLQEEMSAAAAVEALLNPENQIDLLDIPGGATLADLTVVGGDTRYGIYTMISNVTCGTSNQEQCITAGELEDVGANADAGALGVPEWALAQVNERRGSPKRLEGLIAPGRYIVNPDSSAEEILTDLITRSAQAYNETGIVERAGAIGLSPYELLTAASLVEREAPAGEFDKVARVILNRLDEPMRLEFDSTVNYDLEDVEVATTDEDRARETPWNTYAKDGLPETPIASPSEAAIQAMENPAEGDWLFFVTIDTDGTTVFNNTFEEHLNDVQRAQQSGVLDSNR
ncbi:endolytic transglycosylase MltG [Corynebacterium pilosum]|uniref:Endolytic murein transglycosylase n=1 Tax=Corynebacterium pilosum TaxID=35756 RepID=A0A376CQR3_9CORY|nr:endolytic transglycosylase MltG [Corynebacterium pilosum]STC70547.1 predicted periplasmic solute-binding protein [Corynebacterium pilosum]